MYLTELRSAEMARRVAASVLAVLLVTAMLAAGVGATQETPSELTVDPDGSGYDSIRAAIADAESGDTVTVRPGTYETPVVVNKTITLAAPEGATLLGKMNTDARAGIRIVGDAEPTIRGFTIKAYPVGIDAAGTTGDWTVESVRIEEAQVIGIRGADTSGDWAVVDSVVTDASGIGIGAFRSTGNWSLVSVTVRDTGGVGVNARNADGDWLITDTEIAPTRNGTALPPEASGIGVVATNTSGSWTVQNSGIHNASTASIDATGADPRGQAATNWWGENGSECLGNVSCSGPLESRPPGVGATNVTQPSTDGGSSEGGGLPLWLLAVGFLAVTVGGTAVAVRTMGRNAVIDRIEAAIAIGAGLASALPVGGDDTTQRRIVLANVDSQPVTCRVRCRTGDGVQFEYDLQLDPDERREARELPGDRPFEITVQVDGGASQQTFENSTDVVVRVAGHDAEIGAA